MPDLFTQTLAKSAIVATVAGTTHARQSMPSLYRASPPKARHPNQLDLFGDTSISPTLTGDSSPEPALPTEHPDARQQPPRTDDSQPLVEAPAGHGRGADAEEPTVPGVAPGPGTDGG